MTYLSKVIREPLVHFVLIGAAVFGLYALVSGDELDNARDRIFVTEGRVQQLAQVFSKTWQRPPSPEELRGLVDAYIKEEVYYREAIKLGLDRDDTLIRRRMQQKMEFVTEPADALLQPGDDTLRDYLDAHKADFRVEPRFAFEQVFLNSDKPGEAGLARAEQALKVVKASDGSPADVGDPTLLPGKMPISPLAGIERNFGETFAANLTDLPENEWAGPIKSAYGLHLVRVTKRIDGYDPKLADVRDAVAQKWRTEKRDDFQTQAYDQLLAKYDVVLPAVGDASRQPEPQP
ncbi:MAG TPA: peptidyl-prolyl cis-trans isomerase [Methyloceanibacter sp.]|nr:peptidyl-prolyl cis-trans isomerase [Methyloceanibacter sp.]